MNTECKKGEPGPHHWMVGSMVEGITHETCKNCLDERAYDSNGISVPVTNPVVIHQDQPTEKSPDEAEPPQPHRTPNITEHNQAYIVSKHEEYRAREDEIKEAIKEHPTVAAAAKALKIPVTSIRTMLLRWRVKKQDNNLVPRKDLPIKRPGPNQRYHEIEARKVELISIYLREKRAGNTDYGAAKMMGMSASTLVGVKARWKEDINMKAEEAKEESDSNGVSPSSGVLMVLVKAIDNGLEVYSELNDFRNYFEGLKVGFGLMDIPKH